MRQAVRRVCSSQRTSAESTPSCQQYICRVRSPVLEGTAIGCLPDGLGQAGQHGDAGGRLAQLCLRHQHLQLRKEPHVEQCRHGHKHGTQHQNAAELECGHPEGKTQRGAHAAERQQKTCAAADGMPDKDGSRQHAA